MPKDYKRSRREAPPEQRMPAWIGFVLGLAVGLSISLLVLFEGRLVDLNDWMSRDTTPTQSERNTPEPEPAPGNTNTDNPKPKFEFYTLLPEMEVAVPEAEIELRVKKAEPEQINGEAFVLQVGSFRKYDEAERMKASVALWGLEADVQTVAINGQDTWHRVRLGPYSDLAKLNETRSLLRENGVYAIVLKIKS